MFSIDFKKIGLFFGAEKAETAGVTVQISAAADGTDLAVAEKTAQGDGPHVLHEKLGIVVRLSVEILPPAQARKKQRASDIFFSPPPRQLRPQVVARGLGVAQVKLDKLPFPQRRADGDIAVRLVGAYDVADEEISFLQITF